MPRRLIKNTIVSAAAFGVSGVIGLALVPVLVGAYGLAAYGLLALARSFVPSSLLAAFDPGLSEQTTRAIARARVDNDWAQATATVTTLLWCSSFIGLVIGASIILLSAPLATLVRSGPLLEHCLHILIATGLACPILFPGLVVDGLVKGLEEFSSLRATEIGTTIVYALTAVALSYQLVPFEVISYVYFGSLAFRSSLLAWLGYRKARRLGLRLGHTNVRELGTVLRYGMHLAFGKTLTAARDHATLPLISALLGPAAVGIYDILIRVPRFLKVAFSTINLAVLPVATRLDHSKNLRKLQSLAVTGITLAAALALPVCTAFALFSEGMIRFWIGEDYLPYTYWQAFLFSIPAINTLTSFMATLVLSREGAVRKMNVFVLAQSVLFFAIAISISAHLHERAFVLALTLSSLLVFPAQFSILAKELDVGTQLIAPVLRIGGVCTTVAALVLAFRLEHLPQSLLAWFFSVALCCVLTIFLCAATLPLELRARILAALPYRTRSYMEAVPLRNTHDLPGIAIGQIARTLAYSRSIARSLGRMLLRRLKRNRSKVSSEYDQGHWARVLNEKSWLRTESLEDFLVGNNERVTVARMNDALRRVKVKDYCRYRLTALPSLLENYLDFSSEESVVELGCGVGFNLFALALVFPKLKLIGVDYSPNAIAAGRQIADHFNLTDRIRFETLDLTDPQHPGFSWLAGKSCFTFFCIEQIPYEVRAVIKNIIAARPKRVVHVEPTTERLSLSRIGDWANYFYIKSVDYQTQLFSVLGALHEAKEIHVLNEARAPFSPTLQNDGFIVAWAPEAPDPSPSV